MTTWSICIVELTRLKKASYTNMAFSPSFCTGIFCTSADNLLFKVTGKISFSGCLITRKAAGKAEAVNLNSANVTKVGQCTAIMMNAEKADLVRCVLIISCLPGNLPAFSEITKEQRMYFTTLTSLIKPIQCNTIFWVLTAKSVHSSVIMKIKHFSHV